MIIISVKTDLVYGEVIDTYYDDIEITKEDLETLANQKALSKYDTRNCCIKQSSSDAEIKL